MRNFLAKKTLEIKVAAKDYFSKEKINYLNINAEMEEAVNLDELTYVDVCGLLIVQKPFRITSNV